MMGRREDNQVQFLYAFDLDKVVPPDHLVRQIDRVLDLSWVHKERTLLFPYGSPLDRSGSDDPNAACWLRVCAALGATALLRGAGQSGLSLVLQAQCRGSDSRSFGVLPGPARTLP